MCRAILLAVLLAAAVPGLAAKTALDLMLEGRFTEAKAVLDATGASPRYQILYYALTEADAARACSLYQVVVVRYPGSDCDSVARGRLDQAHDMGMVIVPVAEWSQAPNAVKPLAIWEKSPAATAPKPAPSVVVVPQASVAEANVPPRTEPSPPLSATPEKAVKDVVVPAAPESTPSAVVAVPKAVVDIVVSPTPQRAEVKAKEDVPSPTPPSSLAPTVEPKVEPVKEPSPPTKPVQAEPAPAVKDVVRDTTTIIHVAEKPQKEMIATARVPQLAAPEVKEPVSQDKVQAAPAAPPVQAPRVEPKPPFSEPHDRPVPNGQWYIQVGAFGNADNAHRLATSLEKAGFPVKLVPRETSKGTLLQVRVGGYKSHDECSPVAEQLKEQFGVPTVIISE